MSIETVQQYYQECHVDYRIVWRSLRTLSIHYGYFDAEHNEHGASDPQTPSLLSGWVRSDP